MNNHNTVFQLVQDAVNISFLGARTDIMFNLFALRHDRKLNKRNIDCGSKSCFDMQELHKWRNFVTMKSCCATFHIIVLFVADS